MLCHVKIFFKASLLIFAGEQIRHPIYETDTSFQKIYDLGYYATKKALLEA